MVDLLAYVDPGTGALIIQVLIAGAVAGLTFFTNVFQRVGRGIQWIFGKRSDPSKVLPTPESSAPPRD